MPAPERSEALLARYGGSVTAIVIGAIVAVLSVGGAAVWIAMLLWAAREDGRDQKAYDERYGRHGATPPPDRADASD